MRIALVSTLHSPVKRLGAHSIESVVWSLQHHLSTFGHDVTVFAMAGSDVDGHLVATLPGPYGANGSPTDWQLCEWINIARAVEDSARFDIIHAHAYLWGLPLTNLTSTPMLHTLHIAPDDGAAALVAMYPDAAISALSQAQWSAYTQVRIAGIIHHGVDEDEFGFSAEADDYILYMGRFTEDKGPLRAIAAAKEVGIGIKLAGARNAYFDEVVAPLVDGKAVEYVGFLVGAERADVLGRARVLVYPVGYPEPFGLVLVEAMLTGTPVAAVSIGAVPELVAQGIGGYHAPMDESMSDLIRSAMRLDRRGVREFAVTHYSAERMAREYVRLYERVTHGSM